MGHVITIGNAAPCWPAPRLAESPYFDIAEIDGATLGAPIDSCGGTPPTHSNRIWPSYSGWGAFMDRTSMAKHMEEWGLHLWSGTADRLCVVMLCQEHVEMFQEIRQQLPPSADPFDRIRLDWLIWWCAWALANCEHPAIESWGHP